MLIHALILSLTITAIYILFQEGMLLGWFRVLAENKIDKVFISLAKKFKEQYVISGKKWSKYIQKPIWGCLICMASVWTIILTWSVDVKLIFVVCGINVIIDKFINYEAEIRG